MNYLPCAFSFLLPGLGQLYQQRLHVAVIAFAAFTLTHFLPLGAYLSPFVAILASLETFLAEKRNPTPLNLQKEKIRVLAFSTTGSMAFLAWMSLIASTWIPVGVLMEANRTSDRLADRLRRCTATLGRYPQHIQDCNDPALFSVEDPWRHPFLYRRTEFGFEVRSRGRDGKEGTQDDYVFRYRY